MRVLHAPIEVAGQVALSAYGLRELGVDARAFARSGRSPYPIPPDVDPGPSLAGWLRAGFRELSEADVVHYYFGESLMRAQSLMPGRIKVLDARLSRLFGRRIVVEFLGTDVRLPSVEAARNPYFVAKDRQSDARATERMRIWSWATGGHAIICDPALRVFVTPHFEHVHVVPFRVDTQRLVAPPPSRSNPRPLLVHAPSNPAIKGTAHVRAAVEALQARGLSFDYRELRGLPNDEVTRICAGADLVVDQLLVGSHGVFAAEAMSLSKPVICYLEPDVEPLYPSDLPIINANRDDLVEVLARWLQDGGARAERGAHSRAYAERVHDVRVVARQLLRIYQTLPPGNA
jgi:hypothetical protein